MKESIEKFSAKYYNDFLNRSREPGNNKKQVFKKPFSHLFEQIQLKWDKNRTLDEDYANAKASWLDFVQKKSVCLIMPFVIAEQIEGPNHNPKPNTTKSTLALSPNQEDKQKKINFDEYTQLTRNFIDKRKDYFEKYRIHKPLLQRSKEMILRFKRSFLGEWDKLEKIEKQKFNIQNFSIYFIDIWNTSFQFYNFDYLAERDPVLYVFKKEIEKIQACQKNIPLAPKPLDYGPANRQNIYKDQKETLLGTVKNR